MKSISVSAGKVQRRTCLFLQFIPVPWAIIHALSYLMRQHLKVVDVIEYIMITTSYY